MKKYLLSMIYKSMSIYTIPFILFQYLFIYNNIYIYIYTVINTHIHCVCMCL